MEKNIQETITLINKFIQAYNSFDTSNLNNILSEDFEFKNISHGEVIESTSSLHEFSLVVEQSKALFSKREFQIENININGDHLDVSILCNATMAISTIDGLRAGQEISFKGGLNFNIKDKKITKIVQIS